MGRFVNRWEGPLAESTESPDERSGEEGGTYHQIHFAWAEPTLLGRVGPGPAATSLPQPDQPVLRSWRDRLVPALTADYRSALPGVEPADYPETLWAHHYPDGQSALVYRWPGDVRQAHAWAIVGPTHGLTLSRILSLHENPNTRPAQKRPPTPGWATMDTLRVPEPWELAAAPGAVRTRDRRAAETRIGDEPILAGAVARALARPAEPVHITLDPERADLWQATQMRFLWGMHRILNDVLTPPEAVPAAGWNWSFSTYDPVLDVEGGPHLVFGPPTERDPAYAPFSSPAPLEHLKVADGLVSVLREEGGDALAAHLRSRGVPEATTFADRFDLLRDWLAPRPRTADTPADDPAPRPPDPVVPVLKPAHREPETAAPTPVFEAHTARVEEPHARAEEPHGPLEEAPDPFSDEEEGPREREFPAEETPEPEVPEPKALPDPRVEERPRGPEPYLDADRDDPDEIGFHTPSPPPEGHRHEPEGHRHENMSFPGADREEPEKVATFAAPPPPEEHPEPTSSPPRIEDPLDHPESRTPADAPPLPLHQVFEEHPDQAPILDYATETEPDTDEEYLAPDDDWPTHYVDLPLARLERWHIRHGPEGARTDVADVHAAVRAERAELGRVRGERDHYHAEVQELRREIARLDQSWIDADPAGGRRGSGRRLRLLLVTLLLLVVFVVGLEIGAHTGTGAVDLLRAVPGPPWW